MTQPNPQDAAPSDSIPMLGYAVPRGLAPARGGVWRDGATIVLDKSSRLPHACVKCGGPPSTVFIKTLTWYSPLAYFGLLLGLLPFAIVVWVTQKKAIVRMPVCTGHFQARKRSVRIGWGLGVGGAVAAILSPIFLDRPSLTLGAVIVCLIGIILGARANSPLRPKKIGDHFAYLKGAGPEFLNQLPDLQTELALEDAPSGQ